MSFVGVKDDLLDPSGDKIFRDILLVVLAI